MKGRLFTKLLAFFTAFPIIDIAGVSATFWFFIALVFCNIEMFKDAIYEFKDKKILIFLSLVYILSILFMPVIDRPLSMFSYFKLYTQYVYWLLVVVFISYLSKIDKTVLFDISKYMLFGVVLLSIVYFRYNGVFFSRITQNSYAYALVNMSMIGIFYLKDKKNILFFYSLFIISCAILSGSRSGALLIFVQYLGFYLFKNNAFRKVIVKTLIPVGIVIVFFNSGINTEIVRKPIANIIKPYNDEVAFFIANPEIVLMTDESWLIRKLMVQKSLTLVDSYPITGIGIGNFKKIDVKFNQISKYFAIHPEEYNRFSPHNTYMQALAETGYLGFFLFLIFLFKLVKFCSKNIMSANYSYYKTIMFFTLCGMLMYFYTIAMYTGTQTWLVFGLIYSSKYK